MTKLSAGILLYRGSGRRSSCCWCIPAVRSGRRRTLGAWSIPKGEYARGRGSARSSPGASSRRSSAVRRRKATFSTSARSSSRAGRSSPPSQLAGDFDPATLKSNRFELEWPPKSGRLQSFPEVDRAAWFTPRGGAGQDPAGTGAVHRPLARTARRARRVARHRTRLAHKARRSRIGDCAGGSEIVHFLTPNPGLNAASRSEAREAYSQNDRCKVGNTAPRVALRCTGPCGCGPVRCGAPAAKPALAQSAFNPYGSFTDSGPVTPEEKARREQVRTDLYDRLSPAYRIDVPFVSEASIAGLQQAIERYRQIVANGGWPVTTQKVTLAPGRHQRRDRHDQKASHHRGRSWLGLGQQSHLRPRVPRRAVTLPDQERASRQRLRRSAHACRAQRHGRTSACSSSRPISSACKA